MHISVLYMYNTINKNNPTTSDASFAWTHIPQPPTNPSKVMQSPLPALASVHVVYGIYRASFQSQICPARMDVIPFKVRGYQFCGFDKGSL